MKKIAMTLVVALGGVAALAGARRAARSRDDQALWAEATEGIDAAARPPGTP